ncbi:MAG: hypothetical protein ACRD2L_04790, partial [Terriglobia bacterium]
MRIRKKRALKSTVSATEVPELTSNTVEEEATGLPVLSTEADEQDSTQFLPPQRSPITTSAETTGRTWPDVVYPYSSNHRYLYLIVLVVFGLGFGATGHLQTLAEALAVAGLTVASWL